MDTARTHFPVIGSTNVYAKNHAEQIPRNILTVISADEQTEGKGRGHHRWTSPSGVNLYLSFCSFLPRDFPALHNAGQLLGLACSDLLKELNIASSLKWPNDVLIHGKKAAGILCDLVTFDRDVLVINGIGLNVNMTGKDCRAISADATSLHLESEQMHDRDQLTSRFIEIYAKHWEKFSEGGFRPFLSSYRRRLAHKLGEPVSFHLEGRPVRGEFHSIADDGTLNLVLADDGVKNFRC